MARGKTVDDIKTLEEVLKNKDDVKMFEEALKEEVKMTLNYKEMDINDIAAWCKENGQIEWLKAVKAKEVPYTVYPKVRVPKTDDNGNIVRNKKGKILYKSVADKTKAPEIKMGKPNFMHIKNKFVETFMPELKPVKKAKKPTMYDMIDAL